MKIAIDIRSTLKKKTTGIGQYTINLIDYLARIDKKNEYFLYSKKKFIDLKRILPTSPGENFNHCVDYFGRGPDKALPDVDIFHTSSYDIEKPRQAKLIVTVHDVITKAYPHGHEDHTIEEINAKLDLSIDRADVIVADSYSTRDDVVRFYNVHEDRLRVIYPGVSRAFSPIKQEEKEDYLLYVGTLEPRKNIEGVIKAFDWMKKTSNVKNKLYIVGMKGWMFDTIFKEYDKAFFKKDIIFKGRVSDKELVELYQKALVFVYPSFYEGFGFPIVEAFASGTPVVTSKVSSCGEIGAAAALLVDPSDYKDIGRAILDIITDTSLRNSLIKKGLNAAVEFNWEKTAREFLTLFSE